MNPEDAMSAVCTEVDLTDLSNIIVASTMNDAKLRYQKAYDQALMEWTNNPSSALGVW